MFQNKFLKDKFEQLTTLNIFGVLWSVSDEIWCMYADFDKESDVQVKNRKIQQREAKN